MRRLIAIAALMTCTGCSAIATQLSWQLQKKQAEARESLERDTKNSEISNDGVSPR
jgi:tRNA/tmRNA/rRNA uracil-C5-methylase (TrmA/RlmC/RlmD family)